MIKSYGYDETIKTLKFDEIRSIVKSVDVDFLDIANAEK